MTDEARELRTLARLAWNNWPDNENSRRMLADHEQRDPLSMHAWDRVIEATRAKPPAVDVAQLAFEICESLCDHMNDGVTETRELAARVVTSERVMQAIARLVSGDRGCQRCITEDQHPLQMDGAGPG